MQRAVKVRAAVLQPAREQPAQAVMTSVKSAKAVNIQHEEDSMKRLFKAGLVAVTLMWGSAVWAQQCGSGFMDAQGNCHNTNMGTVPMGTQGIDTGSSSNGGGGNSAPPQVIYRKLPDSYGAIAFSPSGAVGTASKQASKQASKDSALRNCGESGCRVSKVYWNSCMAVAWGAFPGSSGGTMPITTRTDLRSAEQSALTSCSKKSNSCKIIVSECSLPS